MLEVTARWIDGYRAAVPIRHFTLEIDEPREYGGDDAGPMPTELFLASLASCFALAIFHAARKIGRRLPDLSVTARGEYEGLRFSRIVVEARSSDTEVVESVMERAQHYCYVSNSLARPPSIEYVVLPST